MGSLMHYSGIATKIRAMGSRLLDHEDFERLAGMESIPEAVEYLSEIPSYKAVLKGKEISSVRRGDIEPLMVGTLYYDFSKLYRFSNAGQKEILKLYFRKYEIAAIKRAMRRIFSDSERAAASAITPSRYSNCTAASRQMLCWNLTPRWSAWCATNSVKTPR